MSSNTQALIKALRKAYAPLVREYHMRGYTIAQIRGGIAALIVIRADLPRGLALAIVRDVV